MLQHNNKQISLTQGTNKLISLFIHAHFYPNIFVMKYKHLGSKIAIFPRKNISKMKTMVPDLMLFCFLAFKKGF
jgi:hypothetical protein